MPRLLLLLVAAAAVAGAAAQQAQQPTQQPPGEQPSCPRDAGLIAAGSPHIVELDALTFWPRVADGRVWFVERFAHWCRG